MKRIYLYSAFSLVGLVILLSIILTIHLDSVVVVKEVLKQYMESGAYLSV